jgi:hypothetical protein
MEFANTAAMFTRSCKAISAVAPLLLATSCQTFAGLDVGYEPCIRPRVPYVEQFDEGEQGLIDRCWELRNGGEGRTVVVEEDLVLGYLDRDTPAVTYADGPPMLLRRVVGDFVMVTHAETTTATSAFCGLGDADSAGFVLRGSDAAGGIGTMAAFLLRPHLTEETDCADTEGEDPTPYAIAETRSNQLSATEAALTPPFGKDGEGDIAICRHGGELLYFYRQPANPEGSWMPEDWKPLRVPDPNNVERDIDKTDYVGEGPLDVGVGTMVGASSDSPQVQGAFNWVALVAERDRVANCLDVLEDMMKPPND